jgi:hypothetical protein
MKLQTISECKRPARFPLLSVQSNINTWLVFGVGQVRGISQQPDYSLSFGLISWGAVQDNGTENG